MQDLLKKMESFAAANKVPIINEQGRKVFINLIEKYQPSKVLEIGTAIGYSALLISAHTQHPVEITSFELSPERVEQARAFIHESPYEELIHIHQGDAAELLQALPPEEEFDLVFIDAAKGQYPNYLRLVLPHLTAEGIIIADNVLFRDYVLGDEPVPRRYKTIVKRLREYIGIISDDSKFQSKIYENGDGLAITKLKQGKEIS